MVSQVHEFRLLLACARVSTARADDAAIRGMLADGIDWTVFTQMAIDHGLASLAGHTLARVAPDAIPAEILDAFGAMIDHTSRRNVTLFEELADILEALSRAGVEAMPFKGPILALRAFGNLGFRVFRNLDFLVRDGDLEASIATLRGFGYDRNRALTAAQFELIHRLQGQEMLFKHKGEAAIVPHTRLIPMKMALGIDYAGLWRRAQRTDLHGRTMLTLAPEDDLVVLAIHEGKEQWRTLKWACDFAAFIGSHPNLDWSVVVERARAQGCLRMVLLAASLARRYFDSAVPDAVAAAERSDPTVEPTVGRIVAQWQADKPAGPPSDKTLSMERLRLHDGFVRRASYVARTVFLPGPHHVASMALPRSLGFAYVPLKLGHDLVAPPLWRACQQALERAGRMPRALAGSDLARAIMPASAETKRRIKRHQRARADAERTLAGDPDSATAWHKLGDALSALKRHKQALACYDKALACYEAALVLAPDNGAIWSARRAAMKAIGKEADLPAIAISPQDADAWAVRAGALWSSRRFAEATQAGDCALAINPGHVAAAHIGIRSRVHVCDWRRREDDKRRIADGLRDGLCITVPFYHRAICDSEAESLMVARLVAKRFPRPPAMLWRGERFQHDRIRVAYLSDSFHDHPITLLMAGVYEQHDRKRFETTAISLGPDDEGKMRRRIGAAFDRFIDAQAMSDAEICTMMREMEIDIAMDLSGYSGVGRPGILAHRPAPVQVNYLAYAGTMGAPFMDYIVADRVVIPDEHRIYYTEKVVYLPNSFMPNDSTRPVAAKTPTRAEAGLPETGFVFACHNTQHKYGPESFDIWMRLLRTIEGSVLWLKSPNRTAADNLRREAKARGVAPERLVFAPRVPQMEDHLARLRLADLFVDTMPFNAHSTACDALWVGLPVLTCMGNTFAGRVAASLLYAIGLPELVTTSPSEYEALALALARDPERLAAIRAKLMRNRDTASLFDTARFTRDLETAYTMMWERSQRGEPPESFSVPKHALQLERLPIG